MTKRYSSVFLSLMLNVAIANLLFGQKSDRVIITGLVTDSAGGAIPQATVTVTNEDTTGKTVVSTTGEGNYSTPPLILGSYTVRVEKEGFKAFIRTGITMSGGTVYRQDVALEIGAVTQTIEVKAQPQMINVEQPDVSSTLNKKYYEDLPVVMGTDMRLAEVLLQVQPGYVPTMPSGDTIFRGSGFNSRMNGGQTMAYENFIDGASFGTAYNHNQTQEGSPPYDAIQEMKVVETTYSAQYGRTSGGFVEYTTKSGNSQLHGSAYYYVGNTALDSRNEFFPQRTKLINNDPGFTLGGPVVIPKVYNGRNKTFFFTNLDDAHIRQGFFAGYNNTVPTAPLRTGDFSSLLDATSQTGADALGRPIYQGEIFNPATTRLVNGTPVRDGYGFSPATGLPILGSANTPTFKMSHTFFLDSRPSIRNCADVGGCNTKYDPTTSPEKNTDYIGDGFYQRISNQFYHQQFDWVIRPNVYNHTTISFDRWLVDEYSLSNGAGWNQLLGIKGIPYEGGGPPAVNFSGNVPYSHLGIGNQAGTQTANRWQFLDDVTWVKGRHTIKAGFEYRWHQFPFTGIGIDRMGTYSFNQLETGGYDALGNNLSGTGDAFASMTLGQVDNANFQIPVNVTWYEAYLSPWVNDEFKVNSKLTLTLGLRFDYQKARTEAHDRYSTFDPTTPNPGAGGLPGAMIFAGTGPGRTGHRTFEDPKRDAYGPRFGFAYRLSDKSVVRGGYGIYYAGVNYSQFAADADIGFSTNPTAPNLTNGLQPAFFWDNGFPQNLITYPPTIDPTVANGTSPVAVAKDDLTLPRYQNWSLTYEAQLRANMALNVSYIGNHATRLPADARAGLGLADNQNDPKILALGASLLQADINSPAAQAAGIKSPYPGFTGDVAQALRPWPQYQLIGYRNNPIAVSFYDALQAVFEKRFSQGFQGRIGFTWSKLINTGAEFALSQTGQSEQNPLNYLRGERGLSSDDVPHVLFLGYTYELPFGPGKKFANGSGPLGKIIGGWGISGIQRYQAGRPLNVTMNNNLSGFLFNYQKRPNKVGPGVIADRSGFDPNKDVYLLSTGWADPGELNFGNASRTDPHVRWFPEYNEDLSLYKDTRISERAKLRYEALFGNVFNRHFYCPPDTNWSDGSFGQVTAQCNVPRRIQFALDLSF